MLAAALTVLLLTAAPDPLKKAQAHFDSGALDEVLFALEGKTFEGEVAARAATLLARAGKKSLDAKDAVFALQFAQMALKHDAKQPLALEVGARAALAQEQFEPAERYADQWVVATADAAPRLFRAELALQQGDWAVAAKVLEGVVGADAERLRSKATAEIQARTAPASPMETAMRAEAIRAAQERNAPPPPPPPPLEEPVVLYMAQNCGACVQTRDYLLKLRVPFFEKDVEKDPAAAKELADKAVAARMVASGVPWTYVKGKLIGGYSPRDLSHALGKLDPGIERLLRR